MQEPQDKSNNDLRSEDVDSIEVSGSILLTTAKRISQRATDLIAIAIVSIGVLTVSGRLTEWWSTDPASMASPAITANQFAGSAHQWGTDESSVRLLAGEYPVQMERRKLFGDQERVDRLLRNRLVEILEVEPSENRGSNPVSTPSDFAASEKQLIERLNGLSPVESRNGRWNLYRLDRTDNPMAGTFMIATHVSDRSEKQESVAAWGIALPSSPTQWTSFVMTPASGGRIGDSITTPLPSDAKLIFTMQAVSNDELTVFQRLDAQRSDIGRWVIDLSSQLTEAGWHEVRPWQQSPDSATARFEREPVEPRKPGQAIELTISFAADNKLTGTVNVITIPVIELVPSKTTSISPTLDRQHQS
ncbi:MAG: hypothetical protein HQ518_03335 [Rhodopirellula sp.]|nr:hypothetical protein [Rhodopirellula sp.]